MTDRSIDYLCVTLINGGIIALFAYIVFWQGHSPWWWLLACVLFHGTSKRRSSGKSGEPR